MQAYTHLVLGLIIVLVVATLIGRYLKHSRAPQQPHAVIDNMNTRIDAWWAIAALVFTAAWIGTVGLAMLFGAASLQALREYHARKPATTTTTGVVMLAATVMQYALAVAVPSTAFALLLPMFVAALMAMPALGIMSKARTNAVSGALLVCVYCVSHVPALAALDMRNPSGSAVGPALFLVIVVQASDVMQYVAGKLTGRHAIAPQLSPGKTIEGALGGLIGAGVLGACLADLTPYPVAMAAATGTGLAALGIAGGLLCSAMKRKRGLKDWGDIVPGHGGVLDRLDSLCLSAPAFYYLLRLAPGS